MYSYGRVAAGLCVLSLMAACVAAAAAAQDGAAQDGAARDGAGRGVTVQGTAAQDKGIRTLHVYANLIQIPVLVVSAKQEPTGPIASNRFRISIDGGPPFRLSHVRVEGDDPISLAIFLDLRGPEDELMPKIDAAIAALAPLSLRPKDHVSIYSLDCGLGRSLNDVPADHARLLSGVKDVLVERTTRRQEKRKEDCRDSKHLWDALAVVTRELSGVPGRRVILAVTNGDDNGSTYKANDLRMLAQSQGVAIFGLAYEPYYSNLTHKRGYDDELSTVCDLSGGMVLMSGTMDVPERLAQFMRLVRGRYIVEFPRPVNSTAGLHNLLVMIEKSGDDIIRPAGISVPVADPALLADPTTVPEDPSLAPTEGKQH